MNADLGIVMSTGFIARTCWDNTCDVVVKWHDMLCDRVSSFTRDTPLSRIKQADCSTKSILFTVAEHSFAMNYVKS
jgi:hypothetical protein